MSSMYFAEQPELRQSGTFGAYPTAWTGVNLPDGDARPFALAPVNSIYLYRNPTTGHTVAYIKLLNNKRNDDWQPLAPHCITKRVSYTDFTDGGGATGTYTLGETFPVGSWAQQCILTDLTGFAGNVSATIQIGDGSDVDRYTTGTPSIFATAAAVDLGVPSGTKIHVTAIAPVITVTASADFTAINAGAFTLRAYYLGG